MQEGMKLGDKLYNEAKSAYEFIESPSDFAAALVARKLDISDDIYAGILKQSDIKNQVFKYTVTQASAGIEAAQDLRQHSPVIGAIQQRSLDRIAAAFNNGMTQFEDALSQVDRWSTDVTQNYRSTGRAYSPALLGKYGARSAARTPAPPQSAVRNCATLKDPAKSEALRQQSEAIWTELAVRCG
ncbi:MAG: hypothetical protein H0U56_13185 [Methylibium sp.]|nr:hypothetical protein [Methylibium sp.]